ncbi:DUF4192 family protein [Microbacterium sp. 1P10UB]|uniref:DUF4192 family protein n=1 Tax=unclassified Microbacterium TaxID=2609290 RepID=UPI0039A3A189
MDTPVVKAADAAQFLALVPRMVGFLPRRSIVLIPFGRGRSLGGMRVDLPPNDLAPAPLAATFIGMVCRVSAVDAVAVVVYTDDAWRPDGMPHRGLAEALALRARECGLHVTDMLCVAADGWGSFLDPDGPTTGRPLDEIAAPEGEMPDLPTGDQLAGAALPAAGASERKDVARALTALRRAIALVCGPDAAAEATGAAGRVDPTALTAMCALDDVPSLFEDALGWDAAALTPFQTALLIWTLGRPSLRDIALVQWCGGVDDGDEALDAQLRWEAGEEYPSGLAMRMWGEGPVPDHVRLARALEVARRAAGAAPPAQRAGALATCAWLSWALGRSSHAEQYASWACEIEPEHGLAEIVRSFVVAGHLPDWAFRAGESR